MGIFLKTLQRHGASRCVPQQAFQLVTPMRWDLSVRMERKPVDTGTAGARQCGVFTFIPKARANAAHVLSGSLPKGDALRDGGRHGAGELGLVVMQRIIPRGMVSSMPASTYPSLHSVRMTRRLLFWTTSPAL